jgi:Subtilase family
MSKLHQCLFCLLLLAFSLSARATETNSLLWDAATGRVSADVRGESLWPLLEGIAHKTGWHIFVEPGAARVASAKFENLPATDALKMLLGDLNFALVPQTNEAPHLYVFTTRMENATRPVLVAKPVLAKQKHVPNELIVKLKPGADIDALAKSLGAKVIGRDDKLGIYRLQFADAAATDAALAQLQNNSDVAAVDYNYIFDAPPVPQAIANAPVGPPVLTPDPSTPNDPCNPVVGLIDTQVQTLGNGLDQFLLKPISVVGDVAPVTGTITHGSAMVTPILTGVKQASGGHSSIRILPVNVYDSGETTTSWNVALGIQAAVDNGATVLNMSLGGSADSTVLDSIVQQALAQGIVIFAAAGNTPVNTPTYPAAIPGVNDVTALSQPGQLASYADFSPQVDMALPGTSIVYLGSQAYVVQGTSPATAYASGIAAGTKGVGCPTWTQIQTAMQQKFPVPPP